MSNTLKRRKIIWQCDECKDIQISDCSKRHQMDWCDCGKSAIDAEEYYTRCVGEVTYLKQIEYDPEEKIWKE